MYFYEVFISSGRYHGNSALTYSSASPLDTGSIVSVPLGKIRAVGFVVKATPKPEFSVKPILQQINGKPLSKSLLALHDWLMGYYPGPSGLITQLFLPSSLLTVGRGISTGGPVSSANIRLPILTNDQKRAIREVLESETTAHLLHGETGTGKTRVYIELAKDSLQKGLSSIILTPEIGLTPQLVTAFEQVFPGMVVLVHSTQTIAERRRAWLKIHTTAEPLIVIGPRSALFSPVSKVGLIVMDEAHDMAYKQEQVPYYLTSRVAAKLATIHQAKLVLGSSTPSVQDYFTFESKELPIIRMQSPAIQADTATKIQVVDMTDREKFSRSGWLSDLLISSLGACLSSHNQALLFLNRRGTARLVLCSACGWQSLCPNCDLPLTYHGDTHSVRCHTCGFTSSAPSSCPECHAADIQFKSVGTKTIVNEIEKLFPGATVKRFDTDTNKSSNLASMYDSLAKGEIDILVGTQLITKGLDIPGLGLVGIVNADTSLSFPDYTAEERTFQMLRQTIGRVGRGHRDGTVIVQTYHPTRSSIVAALNRDYAMFYSAELAERKSYHFPPYYYLLKVSFDRATRASARTAAQSTLSSLLGSGIRVETVGPAPAFTEKSKKGFRWQIILKSKQRSELIEAIKQLPANCTHDIDPSNLL